MKTKGYLPKYPLVEGNIYNPLLGAGPASTPVSSSNPGIRLHLRLAADRLRVRAHLLLQPELQASEATAGEDTKEVRLTEGEDLRRAARLASRCVALLKQVSPVWKASMAQRTRMGAG